MWESGTARAAPLTVIRYRPVLVTLGEGRNLGSLLTLQVLPGLLRTKLQGLPRLATSSRPRTALLRVDAAGNQ